MVRGRRHIRRGRGRSPPIVLARGLTRSSVLELPPFQHTMCIPCMQSSLTSSSFIASAKRSFFREDYLSWMRYTTVLTQAQSTWLSSSVLHAFIPPFYRLTSLPIVAKRRATHPRHTSVNGFPKLYPCS